MLNAEPFTSEAIATELIDTIATFRPPEKERGVMHYVTMNRGGLGGGYSAKPGNIRLSIGKLCLALSKSTFTTVAVQKLPWLLPLGALIIVTELWAAAKIDVTENDASVLFAMWMYKDSEHTIENSRVVEVVNRERAKYGQNLLSTLEVSRSLSALESIRAIERAKDSNSKWWLREWVSINFR